jgi:hypothetical protein
VDERKYEAQRSEHRTGDENKNDAKEKVGKGGGGDKEQLEQQRTEDENENNLEEEIQF